MKGDEMSSVAAGYTGTGWVLGGRYRLISPVGAGGMAVVWQAYDNVLARTVAVKILAAAYSRDVHSRDRIRQEAQAAAILSHPNIAQVYDFGETDIAGEITPYVVMELIRGDTLDQRLRGGPLLPRYAMRVCAEIAAALAAAHTEGLAHRDIKPANIMLGPTGAKVVDFGIAAAIRPPGSGTDHFEVFGTPAYLAPERLLHDAVEPASDVYALGVLLYRLLTGHSPWTSETTTQMLTAHIYLEPAPLLPMFQVPPYVTALCNRCLAKDPAQRPSAREAAALLAQGAGLQVIIDAPPFHHQPATDSNPSVLIQTSDSTAALTTPAYLRPSPPGSALPPDLPPSGSADGLTGAEAVAGPVEAVPKISFRLGKRRNRLVYVLAAVALVAAVATTLWLLRPLQHETTAWALNPPSAVSRAAASGTSTKPTSAAPSRPDDSSTGPVGTTNGNPPPAPRAPRNPITPAQATPTTTAPQPIVTTTVAAPETGERTLSSDAGSVRVDCPSADTAQILSWTATKPYKVIQGDKIAGPSPTVSFKHGNTQVTMTVTCQGGVASATST